jgi:chromosomal replication initiator protein
MDFEDGDDMPGAELGQVDPELVRQWASVRGALREEFGIGTYDSWIKCLTLAEVVDRRVRVAAPTRFIRDWVADNFADSILRCGRAVSDLFDSVEIIVEPNRNMPKRAPEAPVVIVQPPERPAAKPNGQAVPDEFGLTLDARYTFDNFVVGKSNQLAYVAARRTAESDRVTYNPLFLYGPVGLGKTHLMHAIAWQIRERNPQRNVMYISAEKFMNAFIQALRFKTIMDFKNRFRTVDVLMIDDVHFINGRESTQEEFFHTFNALVDQNHQVVVSADKSPSDLDGMEERLRSRLGWGLVADIHPTDYELRLGILQSKAERLGQEIPLKVLEFLAHKITSNVRELEGALNRVAVQSALQNMPITLETAQSMLQDLLRANDRRVTIEEIQACVAKHFNVRMTDMHSARRARAVARPRQIAMYLAKQLTTRSLPEIGRKFGNRDHTTVMHAVRRIDQLRAADQSFHEEVDLLRRMLEA